MDTLAVVREMANNDSPKIREGRRRGDDEETNERAAEMSLRM